MGLVDCRHRGLGFCYGSVSAIMASQGNDLSLYTAVANNQGSDVDP